MLAEQGHDHRGEFRALGLVDAHRVGEVQVALLAALELHPRAVEVDQERAFLVLAEHHAEVAVEDVLVVVIAGLDDLVARLDAPRAGIGAAQAALQGIRSWLI